MSAVEVEIVAPKKDPGETVGRFFGGLAILALMVLFVWWCFAAWFPQLGLTYWQLVLPVYTYRMLNASTIPRFWRTQK